MYEELGLVSHKSRRRIRRLCMLYKLIKFEIPKYLHNSILLSNHQYNTRPLVSDTFTLHTPSLKWKTASQIKNLKQ